jgi:hypothetical protein
MKTVDDLIDDLQGRVKMDERQPKDTEWEKGVSYGRQTAYQWAILLAREIKEKVNLSRSNQHEQSKD